VISSETAAREVRKQRHGRGSALAAVGEGAEPGGRDAGDAGARGRGNPEAEEGCVASTQLRLRVRGRVNISRKKSYVS